MGGPGSGSTYHWWRSRKKTTVEACRQLDANRWMREGVLRLGTWRSGAWVWYKDESPTVYTSRIGYEVCTYEDSGPWVRLHYTFTESNENIDYRIRLVTTRPRYGGLRWWFICPLVVDGRPCGRRVGKLYLPPNGRYFGCRRCYDLTYTSCQESRKYDAMYRRLAGETGFSFAMVKRAMKRLGRD